MFHMIRSLILLFSAVVLAASSAAGQSGQQGWDLYNRAKAKVKQSQTGEDRLEARRQFEQALGIFERAGDKTGVGSCLYDIGSIEKDLGHHLSALEYYQRALRVERENGNNEREVTVLNNMGEVYRNQGRNHESVACYEQSLMIARKMKDGGLETTVLTDLALTYVTMGDLEKGLKAYESALESATRLESPGREASVLTGIGLLQNQMGRHRQALESYEKALGLVRISGDLSIEAIILGCASLVYLKMDQPEKAIGYYEKSLAISRKIGDLSQEATMLGALAKLYELNPGQQDKALSYYEKALEITRRIKDVKNEGATLCAIGSIYNGLGQYQRAVDFYQQALELFRSLGDVSEEAATLNATGGVLEKRGQYQEAIAYHEKALEIRKRIGDTTGEATCLNDIGWVCYRLGRYRDALANYEKSLNLSRSAGSLRLEGTTLGNMGLVFYDWGQGAKALDCHEKSLEIGRKLGDLRSEGIAYNNIGLVYKNSWGQYQKAADYFQKALDVYAKVGDQKEESVTLNNMGQVYQNWGQYQKAVEFFEKALAIRQGIGDIRGEAISLNDIGLVSADLGQDQKAIDLYERSLELSRKIGDSSGEDITLNNLGQRLAALGRQEEALSAFQRSLEARKEMGLPTQWPNSLIGNLYLDMGKITEAEPFLKATGWNSSLARLHLMKADLPAARQYYEKMLKYCGQNRDSDCLFTAYTGLGRVYEQLGDYGKAVEFYEKGVEFVEEMRAGLVPSERNEFLSVRINGFLRSDPAKGLTRVRLKLGEPEAALDSMEITKARAFSDKLFARTSRGNSGVPIEVVTKEEGLIQRLAVISRDLQKTDRQESPERYEGLVREVGQARRDLKEFVDTLWRDHKDYAAVKYPRPLKLRDSAIREDEFILMLDTSEYGVAAVLVEGRKIRKFRFIEWNITDLERTVRTFREPFAKFLPTGFDPDLAHALYERLLAPLIDDVPEGSPIIIVPDGILSQLPFEALIVRGNATWKHGKWTDYPEGVTYLGDQYPVSYYQSITALTLVRQAKKEKRPGDRLLVIADPVFETRDDRAQAVRDSTIAESDREYYSGLMAAIGESCSGLKFVRLPETKILAESLKRLYGPDCEDPYVGLMADKNYFLKTLAPQMDRYGQIVFATHGVLSERLPGLKEPFLALSMVPPGTDGFLRMSDVMSLSVKADLVALTACETGLGRELPGEGVMSMGRAFQYAGACSVLMSLWSVAEKSSVMLVENFFRYRKAGKSKLESLKLARDHIRQEGFEHPFFWAPFILVGEAN